MNAQRSRMFVGEREVKKVLPPTSPPPSYPFSFFCENPGLSFSRSIVSQRKERERETFGSLKELPENFFPPPLSFRVSDFRARVKDSCCFFYYYYNEAKIESLSQREK